MIPTGWKHFKSKKKKKKSFFFSFETLTWYPGYVSLNNDPHIPPRSTPPFFFLLLVSILNSKEEEEKKHFAGADLFSNPTLGAAIIIPLFSQILYKSIEKDVIPIS